MQKLLTKASNFFGGFKDRPQPNTGHPGLKKEFFNQTAQIYKNHYGKSPTVIKEYIKIAKRDFWGLKDSDIQIVIFDGDRKRGVMGIRFKIPEGAVVPSDYFKWSRGNDLEYIF